MEASRARGRRVSGNLFGCGLLTWVAIMVLTGTYLRVRDIEQATQIDWLVAARLAACLAGAGIGVILLRRGERGGPGRVAVLAYMVAAALSVLFGVDRTLVLGYWVLLAGGLLLTLGLVACADERRLQRVEQTWVVVMVVLLLKDAAIGILAPQLQESYGVEGAVRLGMGVTHANALGFGASLAFWLSFLPKPQGGRWVLWLLRLLLLAIVVLSWSRNAMISLVAGGLLRAWLRQSERPLEGFHVRWFLLGSTATAAVLVALLLTMNVKPVVEAALAFNRTSSLGSVTRLSGRSEIWPLAVEKSTSEPLRMMFGHGFGASRLVLNDERETLGFYAANAHNTLLEVVLTTGIFGLIAFAGIVAVSGRWLIRYRAMNAWAPAGMALRAATTLGIILIHSVTESIMGTRIGPVTLLWVFYVAVADRQRHQRKVLGR